MFVDNEWCLGCQKQLTDSDRAYCSDACEQLELQATHDHHHAQQPQPPQPRQPFPDACEDDEDAEDPSPIHYHRAKFDTIQLWRERVCPGAPDDFACSPPSTSSHQYSPGPSSRFATATLLSASFPAPPCLAPPVPAVERRLLPPATDMESLCPPTIALTGEDSLVITPPTQSVAAPAPAIHPATASPSRFKWLQDALHSLRGQGVCVDALPVGIDAATFYHAKSQPVPVPSPQRRHSHHHVYCHDATAADDDADDFLARILH
ncbi:hypothetical protein EXIGLDRAFT_725565 [Exidia glandulosa HHB12029]|uniref:Uncharacterized protein n=1 Tax=Exidia glandulosa HHB12029 TaxID=1314781 RepID=A0A165DZ05_EXIGL|nr:hypothetical protein EXIGLDRAFT_725565 [Exidia glandulosa HHB12029]